MHRRKTREDEGRYLIDGPRAVVDALADGVVETLFATEEARALVEDAARAAGVPITGVEPRVLDDLAEAATPQGVVAVARQVRAPLDEVVGRGVLVVLHEVADPGNAGTIVRTADAAGAAGVVFTARSVDPFHPRAVRAAAGSTTHLPLVVGPTTDEVLAACRRVGQRVVALDVEAPTSIDVPGVLEPPVALLFGNEAHGLPPSVLADVELRVSVPIHGRAESLNLAATAAVALYAAVRRRGTDLHRSAAPSS